MITMASINNNKEFFELLDGTDSHSGSEVQQLVIPPRKKRFRRKLRNNPSTRHEEDGHGCGCKARNVSLTLFSIVLVCWLITLTWLAIVLHKDIFRLNMDFQQFVAAHQGVPDALQECHSLSRELHKNQSAIMSKLAGFSLLLGNFSINLTDVQSALAAVQQQLKTSPSLVNDPRLVKDLSESVAKFGSKIQDLETAATGLKEQDSRQDTVLAGLLGNITDLHSQVTSLAGDRGGVSATELAAQKLAIMGTVDQLLANVSRLNDTLTNKLQWTADDQIKDHKAVESLQEMNQNMTARLTTLEGLCIKATSPPITLAPAPSNASAAPTPLDVFSSISQQGSGGAKGESDVPPPLSVADSSPRP